KPIGGTQIFERLLRRRPVLRPGRQDHGPMCRAESHRCRGHVSRLLELLGHWTLLSIESAIQHGQPKTGSGAAGRWGAEKWLAEKWGTSLPFIDRCCWMGNGRR